MKYAATLIQFSGYPLKIASKAPIDPNNSSSLQVVKPEEEIIEKEETEISKTMDEPENWDSDWFNNYE